ncbi:non-canonical purine NTP pyrophosphatase, rdgB/HAM1 family [Magnetococcus marinus MC-1]|uniref:dITP/XTP pyrophosphatase n=1 Tax=Magnetococcus marinus (strain ATCC BAA-1437 / JCM 17883 / MC-1) TaxID=156889 RepID=A0LC07_MAGMM|nr:RdgB/HAM1 family non-canonical purine NTP pyrophosphatase [Magnetococcus marinus]ABK45500.1 non-canonical purine NTP pyrophosphatase, rdgB/HAM1 family [Magnetococcus marinus MC-1]
MVRLVLATGNRKKLIELKRALAGQPVELLGLDAFPQAPEVVEDGESFAENAFKKAEALMQHTGLAALADDSGLVVDALHGAPGVRSARYAGEQASDAENVDKLLHAMAGHSNRAAHFHCTLALVTPEGGRACFEGRVDGWIVQAAVGEGGFGYDPLFQPEGEARTFAQMAPHEKDAMSHRGRAVNAFVAALAARQGQWPGEA